MLGLFLFASICVFNEDNSHYLRDISEKEYVQYFDSVCQGGVTHFFMCPNNQRSNIETKSLEPMWHNQKPEAFLKPGWVKTTASLHARGVDPYAIWIRRARERNVSPWLSMRMNEIHEVQNPDFEGHSTFWRQHPEFHRVPTSNNKNWSEGAFDYSHPEVREHHTAYVKEILLRYDVDGIEIDWLRFPMNLTPHQEWGQTNCLTEVMRVVRQHADLAAKKWQHPIKVAARVETALETCVHLGADVEEWAKEKLVDWVIPCNFFATANFDIPYAEWRRVLHAVNPDVIIVPGLDSGVVKDRMQRQWITLSEYRGWAENLYAQGAPGIYLFNPFHYKVGSEQWQAFIHGGLSPEAVENAPRAYPVAYRESAINGARNAMQLPHGLDKPVEVRISVGQAARKGEAILALAFNGAVPPDIRAGVTLNDAKGRILRDMPPTAFLDAKTHATHATLWAFPISALKTGANRVMIPATPAKTAQGKILTVIACELYLNGAEPQ